MNEVLSAENINNKGWNLKTPEYISEESEESEVVDENKIPTLEVAEDSLESFIDSDEIESEKRKPKPIKKLVRFKLGTAEALDKLEAYKLELKEDGESQDESDLEKSEDISGDNEDDESGEITEESTEENYSEADASLEKYLERTEYLKLKREFKEAERNYYDVLSDDYSNKNFFTKLFGLGRSNMSPEVQEAHDKFMAANSAYYKAGQESGLYEKISERVNKNNDRDEKLSINPEIVDRHVLNSAERRLELQTMQMPEKLKKIKEGILIDIKKHPVIATAVGGLAVVTLAPATLAGLGATAAGVTAGFATRYIGSKLGKGLVEKQENEAKDLKKEAVDMVGQDDFDLEVLENDIFNSINSAQIKKTAVKNTSRAAGIAAGIAAGGATYDALADTPPEVSRVYTSSLTPDNFNEIIDKSVAEGFPAEVPVETSEGVDGVADIEYKHEVKSGENLSSFFLDSIRDRLASGEFTLPPGVTKDGLSHYMYQSFPDMTSASDVVRNPEFWRGVGIDSGNPQIIKPGETIDLKAMADRMWGNQADVVSDMSPVSTEEFNAGMGEVTNDTNPSTEGYDFEEELGANVGEVYSEVPTPVEAPSPGADIAEALHPEDVTDVVEMDGEGVGAEQLDNTYQISPEYQQMTHKFGWNEGTHAYLTKVMEEGVKSGDIILPKNLTFEGEDFSENMAGLVEYRLPELSRSLFNWDADALTAKEWVNLGVENNNPQDPEGSVVQIGKLIQYVLSVNKDVLLPVE